MEAELQVLIDSFRLLPVWRQSSRDYALDLVGDPNEIEMARIESTLQVVFLDSCRVSNLFCVFLLNSGAVGAELLKLLFG